MQTRHVLLLGNPMRLSVLPGCGIFKLYQTRLDACCAFRLRANDFKRHGHLYRPATAVPSVHILLLRDPPVDNVVLTTPRRSSRTRANRISNIHVRIVRHIIIRIRRTITIRQERRHGIDVKRRPSRARLLHLYFLILFFIHNLIARTPTRDTRRTIL